MQLNSFRNSLCENLGVIDKRYEILARNDANVSRDGHDDFFEGDR